MSIQYQTLTGITTLDNVDYINAKNVTSEELFVTGLNKNQVVVSNAVDKVVSQPLTDGQLLIGNTGTSSYNASTLTSGTNMSVANGAGAITIGTVASPTFTNVLATSITTTGLLATTTTTTDLFVNGLVRNQVLVNYLGKVVSQSLTDGQLLIGNTSTNSYNTRTITSGTNMNIVNGSGSITINTVAVPTFTHIQLTSSGYSTNIYPSTTGSASFTFPPTTGTVGNLLTTDGSGNTSWTGTNSVSNTSFDSFSTLNTVFTNTGFGVTITPRSSTSRVRIVINGGIGFNGTSGYSMFTVMRTVHGISTDLSSGYGFGTTGADGTGSYPWSLTWIDSPATTVATTYGMFCYSSISSSYALWNNQNNYCFIEATEL